MDEAVYETTPLRAIPALFAGAAAGTAVITLALALLGAIADRTAPGQVPLQLFNASFILAPYVFMVFAACAVFVAAPCWWVLHSMGRRTRWDAAALGALLGAAASFVPPIHAMAYLTRSDLRDVVAGFVIMAAAGAVAGFAFWRLAYRAGPA